MTPNSQETLDTQQEKPRSDFEQRENASNKNLLREVKGIYDKIPPVAKGIALGALELVPLGPTPWSAADAVLMLDAAVDVGLALTEENLSEKDKQLLIGRAAVKATIAAVPGPISEIAPIVDTVMKTPEPNSQKLETLATS